jgi:hypothetical protein
MSTVQKYIQRKQKVYTMWVLVQACVNNTCFNTFKSFWLTSMWVNKIIYSFKIARFILPLLFNFFNLLWAFISYKFIEISAEENTKLLNNNSVAYIKK